MVDQQEIFALGLPHRSEPVEQHIPQQHRTATGDNHIAPVILEDRQHLADQILAIGVQHFLDFFVNLAVAAHLHRLAGDQAVLRGDIVQPGFGQFGLQRTGEVNRPIANPLAGHAVGLQIDIGSLEITPANIQDG